MSKLDSNIAKIAAEKYIERLYNPLESNGFMNYYFVKVGEDMKHQPNSIYTELLPENQLIINDSKAALRIFMEKCDYKSEFLLKVIIDKKNKQIFSEILSTPNK